MREFIEALFEKENKIEFQYEDYLKGEKPIYKNESTTKNDLLHIYRR